MPEIRDIPPEPEQEQESREPPRKKLISRSYVLRSLQAIQKYSAYGFHAFAVMHFVGVVATPVISTSLANSTIMFTRTIYQSTLGEPLLVWGTAGLHVAASTSLRLNRMISTRRNYGKWDFKTTPLQKSGWILLGLVTAHFTATRLGALLYLDGDSSNLGLEYMRWILSRGLSENIPNVLLVLMYSYHSISGLNRWLKLGLKGRTRNLMVGCATLLSVISLFRIGRLPLPTASWQIKQFEEAYKLISGLL